MFYAAFNNSKCINHLHSVSKCRCDLFQLLETSRRNETLLLWFLLLASTLVSTFLFSEKKHNTVDVRWTHPMTRWLIHRLHVLTRKKYRSDLTLGCSAATAWMLEFGANQIQCFVSLLVCNLRQKDDTRDVKAVRRAGFCFSVGRTCFYEL